MKIRKRNVFPLPYPARVVILLVYLIILSYFLFFSESFGRTGQDHIFAVNLVPSKERSGTPIERRKSNPIPPSFIGMHINGIPDISSAMVMAFSFIE